MRRVLLSVYVSLDGVSDMDKNDQWTFLYWNQELEAHQQYLNRADALLLGRNMFEHFAEAWSPRTNEDDPMSDRITPFPSTLLLEAARQLRGGTDRYWKATRWRRYGASKSRKALPACVCRR